MSIRTEIDEINEIVARTLDNLKSFIGVSGRPGAELRWATGDLAANCAAYLSDGTFAQRLMVCFRLATQAGITVDWMDRVLKQLVAEMPTALTSSTVVQNSLLFALAQDGRIIAKTEFKSRDDVDAMMKRMRDWFDIIRDLIADTMSGPGYQSFLGLAAGITRYLTDVARPLPRMVNFELSTPMPALAVSQLIYGEGDRAYEVTTENKIIHPLFMRRELRVLGA